MVLLFACIFTFLEEITRWDGGEVVLPPDQGGVKITGKNKNGTNDFSNGTIDIVQNTPSFPCFTDSSISTDPNRRSSIMFNGI